MEATLDRLNPSQREAVTTIEGPLLVLAGAGTGKTRVITHRMAYLIYRGVAPSEILALTFTNKAAREMKERFGELAAGLRPPDELARLIAGTFHSFCVRVLRRHIHHLQYKGNFAIAAGSDQTGFLKEALTACGIQPGAKEVGRFAALISRAKNQGCRLESLDTHDPVARVWNRYQDLLHSRNSLDFDDLLVKTVELLTEYPEVRKELRGQLRYLLVDEYQDTNRLQFDLLRCLASDRQDVCVVGDDDQSIYSWRGAESQHILNFSEHFPGARSVKLEQNYRCTPTILQAANAVIRHNLRRHVKELWSNGPEGEKIRLVSACDEVEEANWIATDLWKARESEQLRWEEAAVLYRANHLSRIMEQTFRQQRIPYQVVGGQEFYDRREVKDALAYLQVCLNPDDDLSLLRILNVPARGIGKAAVQTLLERSKVDHRSVWHEIIHGEMEGLSSRSRTGLASFRELVESYGQRFQHPTGWSGTFHSLLADIGYAGEIRRTSRDGEDAASRLENVQETVNALAQHEERRGGTLQEFLDAMLLRDREDGRKDREAEPERFGVTLMTLHAAKGLEFSRVYLVGVEEGILPHDRVKLEGNTDEERRLFYVGITRAKHVLSLSHCGQRKRYGQEDPCHPSSFLDELPEETLERVQAGELEQEVSKESAADQFAAFRARLGSG